MGQHDIIKHDFILLQSKLEKLKATDLTQTQKDILNQIEKISVQSEKHLFEDYINFEEICDKLPEAIYVADKIGTTIYVNDCYTKLSGITRSEVIGENIHQINREKKLYTNGILPTILKTERSSEKIGVMNKTNTTVHISGFPIFDDNHQLKYAVACDRDIQQLETVKDQLIQLKEAVSKKESENAYLRTQQIQQSEVIFESEQMYQAVSTALAVAPTDATVLITGESGTGKEVITNQIYQASHRFGKPFLKINCAAIPDTLMESELFGYEPGAFTGASKSGKTGIFELANGGTLMEPYVIDEIQNTEGSAVEKYDPETYGTLMSSSESSRLTEMMKAVVSEGTGYKLSGKSYSVAGKTGTAEVVGRGNNAWFVGFAPADDPKIAICVLVEDAGTASSEAVPIVGEILDAYLGD